MLFFLPIFACLLHPGECGHWTGWTPWTPCSRTCGGGNQFRLRTCAGGNDCIGANREDRPCNVGICHFWASWTPWTACSRNCGLGDQFRLRTCVGGRCAGHNREDRKCNPQVCSQWSAWATWTPCSKSCGPGNQFRLRSCLRQPCLGNKREDRPCNVGSCYNPLVGSASVGAIYGRWNHWLAWTPCSKSCGSGTSTRHRTCHGLQHTCIGTSQERRVCNPKYCPIGQWNHWTMWSFCDRDCGTGRRRRFRLCSGMLGTCIGHSKEQHMCNLHACANGESGVVWWNEWLPWLPCTKSCSGGFRIRIKLCSGSVESCPGLPFEHVTCNQQSCDVKAPSESTLHEWTMWSICSSTCGHGIQIRTETCASGRCEKEDPTSDVRPCFDRECHEISQVCPSGTHCLVPAWSAWEPWSECTKTCGNGQRSRSRVCPGTKPSRCTGTNTESEYCNADSCASHWAEWSSFSDCTVTCGGGARTRSRECKAVDGQACLGSFQQGQLCNFLSCKDESYELKV